MGDMREMPFRGKTPNKWDETTRAYSIPGKWVYGTPEPLLHKSDDNYLCMINGRAVIRKTVGEYTGLKDRDGVRIFEGDIVKIDNGADEETIIGFVVYEYASWQIDCGSDFISLWRHLDELKECQSVEIIGNVHDAPELLKGGEA
jgi:uncharacterized phage protein (TIGR01671 family)